MASLATSPIVRKCDRITATPEVEPREPYTLADLEWAATELNSDSLDYEVVESPEDDDDLESDWDRWHREAAPESPEEYEPIGILAGLREPE